MLSCYQQEERNKQTQKGERKIGRKKGIEHFTDGMVEKRREALETKVERWKWALERVYLTRVLTRIVRLVAAASRSRSPSPRKAFSKVLPTLCTAAFLNGVLLRRRINAIIVDRSFSGTWPGGRGEWRRRRRRRRRRGLRIRCFPLEFADGEAGNFYQRGNKGLWR